MISSDISHSNILPIPSDPSTWSQTDAIYRVSIQKPPLYHPQSGLSVTIVLHNDFCTRISCNDLTVNISWSLFDPGAMMEYRIHGMSINRTTTWSFPNVTINEFTGCPLILPITRVAGPSVNNRRVPNVKQAQDPAFPIPFKSLEIKVMPNCLTAFHQLWPGNSLNPGILPVRIDYEQGDSQTTIKNVSRTILGHNGQPCIEFQEPLYNQTSSPLGSYVWDAGLVLAAYLSTRFTKGASPRTIIELGAGNGFLGKVLRTVIHPKTQLILTDVGELVPFMQTNLSNYKANVLCIPYSWGDDWPIPDLKDDLVVVGSDIVYNSSSYPLLISTLVQFRKLWPRMHFIFAFKRRSVNDEDLFLNLVVWDVIAQHNRGLHDIWDLQLLGVTAGEVYVYQLGPV